MWCLTETLTARYLFIRSQNSYRVSLEQGRTLIVNAKDLSNEYSNNLVEEHIIVPLTRIFICPDFTRDR